MKKIVFRVDAYEETGSGHIIRCLTIAKYFLNHALVIFICRSISGNLYREIISCGIKVLFLDAQRYLKNFEVLQIEDAVDTIRVLKEMGTVDCLIVDNYALFADWEIAVYPFVKKLFVIDDLASNLHYCDGIMNSDYDEAIAKKLYKNLLLRSCKKFFGPQFLILREEFYKVNSIKRNKSELKKILITFGGSDPANVTELVIKAVRLYAKTDVCVYVVIGGGNPRWKNLQRLCSEDGRFIFLHNIDYMANIINEVDLVIGAAGITAWECCYMQTPLLAVSVAENQRLWAERMKDEGIFYYLGDVKSLTYETVCDVIRSFLKQSRPMYDIERAHNKYFSRENNIDDFVKAVIL